jgi:hypothetical protein
MYAAVAYFSVTTQVVALGNVALMKVIVICNKSSRVFTGYNDALTAFTSSSRAPSLFAFVFAFVPQLQFAPVLAVVCSPVS